VRQARLARLLKKIWKQISQNNINLIKDLNKMTTFEPQETSVQGYFNVAHPLNQSSLPLYC